MPRPPFQALSRAWDNPGGEALIGQHRARAEWSARSLERKFPGTDWLPIIFDGLYLAAYTFDATRATWEYWLERHLSDRIRQHAKTWIRRERKLRRHSLEDVDKWVRRLL